MAEQSADRNVTKVGRCPIYEVAQVVEMDNETVEALCRAGARCYMDTMAKEWNPDFSYRLREFRSAADGHCIEEVVLG